jgi:hypothetical protein
VITDENNHRISTSILSLENNVLPNGNMPRHLEEKFATTIKVGHIERHVGITHNKPTKIRTIQAELIYVLFNDAAIC